MWVYIIDIIERRNCMGQTKSYWEGKTERAVRAKRYSEIMDFMYHHDISNSVNGTIVTRKNIGELTKTTNPDKRHAYTESILLDTDTVSAIMNKSLYCEKDRICVLNFSSHKNPGGKFLEGSSAQEESLCHESTLFNVLKDEKLSHFYEDNKKGTNRCIYDHAAMWTPKIIFRRDRNVKMCDVITCAAPNATAAMKFYGVKYDEIMPAFIERVRLILLVASNNLADVLILGAYGCGVFGNKPDFVATTFKKLIDNEFNGCFKKVIYAVPSKSNTKNYTAFLNMIHGDITNG